MATDIEARSPERGTACARWVMSCIRPVTGSEWRARWLLFDTRPRAARGSHDLRDVARGWDPRRSPDA